MLCALCVFSALFCSAHFRVFLGFVFEGGTNDMLLRVPVNWECVCVCECAGVCLQEKVRAEAPPAATCWGTVCS